MTAYIAAPFNRREEAREARRQLAAIGIQSNARWIDSHNEGYDSPKRVMSQAALEDLDDVARADMLVYLAGFPGEGRGGKDVEMGYAIGRGKRVVVVGEPYHVFHYLPQVQTVGRISDIRL